MKCPKCGSEIGLHVYQDPYSVWCSACDTEFSEFTMKQQSIINQQKAEIDRLKEPGNSDYEKSLIRDIHKLQDKITALHAIIDAAIEHEHCDPHADSANAICQVDRVLEHYMSEHNMSDWWCGCVEGHRCIAEFLRQKVRELEKV